MEFVNLNAIFAGFITAVLVALTGVGGGAVMTPMLTLWLKLPIATAIGTDLIYVVTTKISSAYMHHKHGRVNWQVAGKLLLGSVPTSIVVVLLMRRAGDISEFSGYLGVALGLILAVTAILILYETHMLHEKEVPSEWWFKYKKPKIELWKFIAAGILLGLLVTTTSIGAGAIGVLLLLRLMPRAKMSNIVGTDIAQALPLALVAGVGYLTMGNVNWVVLGSLLIGMAPGVFIGNRLSGVIPDTTMRTILAVLIFAVSVVFLYKYFWG